MNYQGVVIEESLGDKSVIKDLPIVSTKVEQVTSEHKTPWIKQWTLHTVEVPQEEVDDLAKKLSCCLDKEHEWYADFKNETTHFIIFRDKVFKINRRNVTEYEAARNYGISLRIPEYQVNFIADLVK